MGVCCGEVEGKEGEGWVRGGCNSSVLPAQWALCCMQEAGGLIRWALCRTQETKQNVCVVSCVFMCRCMASAVTVRPPTRRLLSHSGCLSHC